MTYDDVHIPTQVGPRFAPLKHGDESTPLDYNEVIERLDEGMDWLARLYCNTMNVIHYMHDKYDFERVEMALHDTMVRRLLAFGISGLSVAADSLSAIKHAKVFPVRDERGLATEFRVEGEFPAFGNDDERVDDIAAWLVRTFYGKLAAQETYRGSIPTLSALTITSNVVYGQKTGSTPDGRKKVQRACVCVLGVILMISLFILLRSCFCSCCVVDRVPCLMLMLSPFFSSLFRHAGGAICPRSKPTARPRLHWRSGIPQLSGASAIRVLLGRHLQHVQPRPSCAG